MLPPTRLTRALTLALGLSTAHVGVLARPVFAQEEPVRRDIIIEVQNDNFHDATVYAVRSGLRQRLGFVGGFTKDTFKFLWPSGDLRIEINFLAGGRYYSQVMDVQPGDELELRILPSLHTLPSGTVF